MVKDLRPVGETWLDKTWLDRPVLRAACGAVLVALLVPVCAPVPTQAQGKLDARYVASLAGVPIGKGAWVIDINDTTFTSAASGKTTGLMRVLASGHGTSASRGDVIQGRPVASSYATTMQTNKKFSAVRMKMSNGNVRDYVARPPSTPHPKRVPLTAAHRRGVFDPMTASLLRVPGNGNPVSPEACRRKVSVFDGRIRYDLQLAYKRMEQVSTEKGYRGPVVVCAVHFSPVAGHVPHRKAIQYIVKLRDIEVWFAPIMGTRVLAPYRFSIPTPIGLGVMQATQFVSTAQPSRPIPTSARAQ